MLKSAFAIQPKLRMALILLLMITLLLSGILIERHYLQKVDHTSTTLYEDRLMPATFVYQLTDRIHQRYREAENMILRSQSTPTTQQALAIQQYQQQMDDIMVAFEQTYLVTDESASLKRLQSAMTDYDVVEKQFLQQPNNSDNIQLLDQHLDAIRNELLQLSSIQTVVGKELLSRSESTVAQAYALNNLEIGLLVLGCLIAQLLILGSKSVRSPIAQQAHLN